MTMTAYLQGSAPGELTAWGRPEDIGSISVEGDIQCAGRIDLGDLSKSLFGGLYSATQGKYRAVYPFHEHATLLEGRVALTDEATGETVEYGPGDSWIIAKGTSVLWDIRSAIAVKSFLAVTVD